MKDRCPILPILKQKEVFVSVHSPSFVLCLMFDEGGKIKIRKMIILGQNYGNLHDMGTRAAH